MAQAEPRGDHTTGHFTPDVLTRSTSNEDRTTVEKGKAALAEAKSRKERFDSTHPGRLLKRVSQGNGNLLAGGIAYLSLTSLAAALVIAVSISTYLVHFNEKWNEAFFAFIDDTIPGVIKECPGAECPGLVYPEDLKPQTITGIVGVIGFLILINATSRYVSAMRIGSLAMLGTKVASPVKGKLRDFGTLAALLVVVLLGAVLQVAASQFSNVIAGWLSDQTLSAWIVRGSAFFVGVLVDMAFLALCLVVLGGYRGPRLPLLWAMVAAAIAMGILRQAVSLVVGGVTEDPVLGSAAAIISIMIFVNFTARIVLYAAAWLGTLPASELDDGRVEVTDIEPVSRRGSRLVTTARAKTRKR
jgi:membrane protein